jgi:hypothetical protein
MVKTMFKTNNNKKTKKESAKWPRVSKDEKKRSTQKYLIKKREVITFWAAIFSSKKRVERCE